MDDIGILKAADNMYDGIALADICKKLIAESLTLGGSLDKTSDIDELDRRRGEFL